MKFANPLFALTLAFSTLVASAQTAATTEKNDKPAKAETAERSERPLDSRPMETFYLANSSGTNQANEVLTAMRLMLDPVDKLYLTPGQNAISVRARPEEFVLVKQILAELDRPSKVFRLTYTIEESDAGKRIGIQHFTMMVANGQRTDLKEGSRVPIATGSYQTDKNASQTQFTYLDIGLNFQATISEFNGGVRLQSKVEQSTLAQERSGVGESDPIVRQAVLEGTSLLTLGKSQTLGSLDVPGSTRHLDIEAIAEQVK